MVKSGYSVLRKPYWEVGMRVNYCSVDLHRSEREVIVVNKKTKPGNVSKNASKSRVQSVSPFESIVIF